MVGKSIADACPLHPTPDSYWLVLLPTPASTACLATNLSRSFIDPLMLLLLKVHSPKANNYTPSLLMQHSLSTIPILPSQLQVLRPGIAILDMQISRLSWTWLILCRLQCSMTMSLRKCIVVRVANNAICTHLRMEWTKIREL